jgi:hypothetical protein
MSAAPSSQLGPGSLVIPITGDLSGLNKSLADAETKADSTARRIQQKAQAADNRTRRIQQSVGGAMDAPDQIPDSMSKGAGKATASTDRMNDSLGKSVIQMGAVAAAARIVTGTVNAYAEAVEKAERGEISFNEALQDTAKGFASSVPIVGQFFDAGVKIRGMIDGTTKALIEQDKAQKAHNERVAEANKKNAAEAKKRQDAIDDEARRQKKLNDEYLQRQQNVFGIISQLEEETARLTMSEEELLTRRLKAQDASKESIELAKKQLAINNEIKAQKEKEQADKQAADEKAHQEKQARESAAQLGASRIENLERELAILQGIGDQYEENLLRSKGVSEEDLKRAKELEKLIEREKTIAEIKDLEPRRFREATTGAMEVDRSRTAFGAPTAGGKMEVEDKAVARQIDKLNITLKSMVLQ